MALPKQIKDIIGKVLNKTAEVGDAIELIVFIRDSLKKDPPKTMKPRADTDVEVMNAIKNVAAINGNLKASRNLVRLHRARQNQSPRTYGSLDEYGIGEESDFMEALGKIVNRFRETAPQEIYNLFEWLGEMTDEEFDAAIEMLLNDGAEKHYRAVMKSLKSGARAIGQAAVTVGNGIVNGAKAADNALTKAMEGPNEWASKLPGAETGKPDFGRLAFWRRRP